MPRRVEAGTLEMRRPRSLRFGGLANRCQKWLARSLRWESPPHAKTGPLGVVAAVIFIIVLAFGVWRLMSDPGPDIEYYDDPPMYPGS